MNQTEEARQDAHTIENYVEGWVSKTPGYAHYLAVIKLTSMPYGWDENRTARALIDYADGGWSPFGGNATPDPKNPLFWTVKVYTD